MTDRLTVKRLIRAKTTTIFDVLADPNRHTEQDSTGILKNSPSPRITGVGDVFVSNNNAEIMGGDYTVECHVTTFDEPHQIAWRPASPGGQPMGHEWGYELRETDMGVEVTHYYDWTDVQGEARGMFPAFPAAVLESSLERLAGRLEG